MSLAEVSNALQQKDVEKNVVLAEIEKLRDMRDEGSVAILHATVYGIAYASHDESKVKFSYQLFEEGQTEVSSISIDQDLNDAIKFNLASKTGKLVISATFTAHINDELDPEAEPVVKIFRYRSEFEVAEIPEDGELRTDIVAERIHDDAENEESIQISFKFKTSLDDVAALLASKDLELQQLEEELVALSNALREANKKQQDSAKTASKKEATAKRGGKAGKKVPRASSSDAVGTSSSAARGGTAPGVDEEAAPQGPSYLDLALSSAMTGGAFVLQNYAYVTFGAAALVIHLYGDYASV